MTRRLRFALLCLCLTAMPVSARMAPADRPPLGGNQGQGRQGGRQGPPQGQATADPSALSVQQMFDAMAVLEAERFLTLAPEQYPTFVRRLRKLQEVRAQFNRQRIGFLNELRRMTQPNATNVDDAAIETKLKDLERVDTEGRQMIRRAFDELDGTLTPRQRARFRVLEDNLEKKKLAFLAKARQGDPGGGPGRQIR